MHIRKHVFNNAKQFISLLLMPAISAHTIKYDKAKQLKKEYEFGSYRS